MTEGRSRFRAIAWLLALGVGLSGCSRSPRFDETIARSRLQEFLDSESQSLEVLAHKRSGSEGAEPWSETEYWILLSSTPPSPPGDVEAGDRRSPQGPHRSDDAGQAFPASALLSFAASVGVPDERLGRLTNDVGSILEWDTSVDGERVRLRTVQTDSGFVSVLERLPSSRQPTDSD